MLNDLLTCSLLVAGLLSLLIESPINQWLREKLAGAPSREVMEAWRDEEGARSPEPRPENPWLDEKLQCPACVGFWVAGLVTWAERASAPDLFSWALLWAGSWILGRLLLGLVRFLEFRADG